MAMIIRCIFFGLMFMYFFNQQFIECTECEGKGSVMYGPTHTMVIHGVEKANIKIECPICHGAGRVWKL